MYNKADNEQTDVDNEFVRAKINIEEDMAQELYVCNEFIIKYEELFTIISRFKNGKTVGIDRNRSQILKCNDIKQILLKFLQYCFEFSMIPNIWPKSATTDPCYQVINPLFSVYKVYSILLNRSVLNNLEYLGFFVDEQNRFRHDRSCQDHIFSLLSIVRNSSANHKPTFAAFDDLQKAFERFDRDLLMFK